MPPIDDANTDGSVDADQGGVVEDNSSTDTDTSTDDTSDDAGDQGDSDTGDTDSTGEDDSAGSEGAPEAYSDFTMPEGVELDAAALETATPLFKEAGLTQEQAQMFVDYEANRVQETAQAQSDAFNQQVTDWEATAKADKEIGGDKFDENLGVAMLGMEKLGTPELKDFLEKSGAGSHPEVLRTFYRMGMLLKEDDPGSNGGNSGSKTDRVSIMYPDN